MVSPQRRFLVLIGAAIVTLTGCFTGQRPTLVSESAIDDPAAKAVVERLNRANTLDFIARYHIIPSLTGATTEATVAQRDGRRKITIGNVEYTTDGVESQTCQNNDEGCVDFLDEAPISDLNITQGFWGPAFRSRLELDAKRRIGPSAASTTTIAGHDAVCVDVILPSVATTTGTVVYCALDAGVLARYFGADVSIELVAFSREVLPTDLTG